MKRFVLIICFMGLMAQYSVGEGNTKIPNNAPQWTPPPPNALSSRSGSGKHLNNGYSWSPNVESVFKYTSADLGNALRKPDMPYSTILGHPLKLEGEVKVQAFNDQTLRVKLDHIHFYSNGTEISLTNAHQILHTERSNGGLMGHTVQIFENSLIAPFMVLTKGGVLKKMIVSMNEPAEVTEIKKLLASDLEMKTNQVQLDLVMQKAINTPLATPRFPSKVDLEVRSVDDEEALGVLYGTGAVNDTHETGYHKSALRNGNLVSGNLNSPGLDIGCLDRKNKCQPGMKCVWKLRRDGVLFGECKEANKMKEGPMIETGNDAQDIETYGSGSGSAQINCISWRQTGGCNPYGPRQPQFDKPCDADIPFGASGYCQCSGGIKQMMKKCSEGEFRNCNEACKKGPCANHPCLNGGICHEIKTPFFSGSTCLCQKHYYGRHCQNKEYFIRPKGSKDCGWSERGKAIMDAKTCRVACKILNVPQKQILGANLCYKDSQGNCYQNGRNGAGDSLVCQKVEYRTEVGDEDLDDAYNPSNEIGGGHKTGTGNDAFEMTKGYGARYESGAKGSPSEYLSATIMAQRGTERRFSINVPSGKSNLTVAISGGTGDADLYVKYGEAPSLASYDCRPYKYGNLERCSFRHQDAGTWYILVYAYSSYSGVKLTAGESNEAVTLNQSQTEMATSDDKKGEELDRLFDKATRYIRNLPPRHLRLSLETQLFFYSRYKQAKVGQCNIPKPYFMDTMATQKWKAWKNLSNMSKDRAKSEYIQKLDTIAPEWRNKDGDYDGLTHGHAESLNAPPPPVGPCRNFPCLNGARCHNRNCYGHYHCSDYTCTCPLNYFGKNCQDRKFYSESRGSLRCAMGKAIMDEKTCKEACKALNVPQIQILGDNLCYKDFQGNCYQNGKNGAGASLICKKYGFGNVNTEEILGGGYRTGINKIANEMGGLGSKSLVSNFGIVGATGAGTNEIGSGHKIDGGNDASDMRGSYGTRIGSDAVGTCEAKHAKDSKQCSALRKNDHVVIMNRPCKIVEISTKTGKDGQSEVHSTCIDIFTQKKLNDNCPPDESRDVPNIKSKDYMLLDVDDNGNLSLMDPDTGDTREDLSLPPEPELADEIRGAISDGKSILCIVLSACGDEAVIGTKVSKPGEAW